MIIFCLILFAFCQAQITQLSCGLNCDYTIESLTMMINVDGIIDSRTQWDTNKSQTINTLKIRWAERGESQYCIGQLKDITGYFNFKIFIWF